MPDTPDAPRADPSLIVRLTDSLRHHGPDQQGVWTSDAVSLGAVRLKIIDLDGGEQPFATDDGRTVLAYNGEIYNYREVRDELAARGHRFRSRSDTEVLLRAFLEWDTDCFRRLKGMFAAALWQQPQRRLVLARDRLGIKPLYVARRGGAVYFGSEMKVLLAHPDLSRDLDLAALDLYLSLNYVPGPRTMVQGIEKLPPGHVLEWRRGETSIRPYWELKFDPDERLTEPAAAERLDHLLRVSMRQHLISDVPLGVLLSGGIDSSTMVHYAAEHSGARLKTFSVSFAGRSFDESRYFRAIAQRYSTEHHEFDLARDLDLASEIREFAAYADEPCGDSSSLPVWCLSRLCRRHVTVALSGEGADELFGGYLTYQADHLARLARALPSPLLRAALAAARLWPVSDDKIPLEYMAKRFLEGTLLPPLEAHCYWNGAFSEPQKRGLRAWDPPSEPALEALAAGAPRGPLNRYLWFDQRYYLPDDILAKIDRMSMAHSLEVRPPFLDHEIVEFAARLPERMKIRGRRQKWLLKRLMRGSPAALARTGLFRPGSIERLVQHHLDGRLNIGFHLWGLMILLLWMDRWQIRSPLGRTETPAVTTR